MLFSKKKNIANSKNCKKVHIDLKIEFMQWQTHRMRKKNTTEKYFLTEKNELGELGKNETLSVHSNHLA